DASLAIVVRRDQAVLPAALPATLPDPAAGHRLAVTWRAGQQHAALGPAAVGLDAIDVRAFQVADGVAPELVELLLRQDGRCTRRLTIAAAAQGDAVEPAVGLLIDGDEIESPDVGSVVVVEADSDEANALDFIDAHAELEAGSESAVVRIPVAHKYAVEG